MQERNVLLLQLPIPPPGPVPVRGNIPLAAGYLKLLARQRGLERDFAIDIFPADLANRLSDQGLVEAILARDPWLVGFTCYLWNIVRTLWVARQLKARRPELRVLLGGPEITADNAWVLHDSAIDYACIGEGEQTFCELLEALRRAEMPPHAIDGLLVADASRQSAILPAFRKPLPRLDEISSPYLAGILDAAEEQMLLLETIRGCVFKCKFCYYPKAYDALYFLSRERLVANLEHARQRGVTEVVLLDPTLNQRRDFADFVRLLRDQNPRGQFTYFGELRAEGINAEIARLLREANFTEVEIGLQSVEPRAQELMDRTNNLRAFERGVRAMLEAGIKVKVDLIIGLPGDTADTIRRGIDYLIQSGLYTSVQVFNLAILPGTAFRHEAAELGLEFQPRPPYYVTRTPTLQLSEMLDLMDEAEEAFGVEFDPLPPPKLEFEPADAMGRHIVAPDVASHRSPRLTECATVNLDGDRASCFQAIGDAGSRTQAFTLWLQSHDFHRQQERAADLIRHVLRENPFTTLQVVVQPQGDPSRVTPECLERLARACFEEVSYLDKFYAVLPGRAKGAKRLMVILPDEEMPSPSASSSWRDQLGDFATIVSRPESALPSAPAMHRPEKTRVASA